MLTRLVVCRHWLSMPWVSSFKMQILGHFHTGRGVFVYVHPIQGCVRFMLCWYSYQFVFLERFNPDRFADESVMKSFSLLGFSGSQACPELR